MEKLYDAEKLQIFIHFFGVVFFDGLLDVQDLNLYGLGSETDLQNMRRGGSGGFGENEVLNDFEVVTLMLSDFLRADVPQSFPDCGRGAFRAKDNLKRSIVWTRVL